MPTQAGKRRGAGESTDLGEHRQPIASGKTERQRGMVVGDEGEDSHDSHARYRPRGSKSSHM